MIIKLLVSIVCLSLLSACSQITECTMTSGIAFPVKVYWMSTSTPTESLNIELSLGKRKVLVRRIPSEVDALIGQIQLHRGVNMVLVNVPGKVSTTMAVQGAPDQEIVLFLNPVDEMNDNNKSPFSFMVGYFVKDHSPSKSMDGIKNLDNTMLSSLVPITVRVYNEDSREPTGSAKFDFPLRMYIDKSMVYNGVARAGNLAGALFVFRVKPGIHIIQFRCGGESKSCIVNAVTPSWVSAYYGQTATPRIDTTVSNDVIPAM